MRTALRAALPLSVGVLLVSLLAAASVTRADDGDSLEGTWQISTPRAALALTGGAIPFTAKGRERYQHNKTLQAKRDYDDYDLTLSRCSSPGVPRIALTPKRFRIWQRPHVLTISYEWNQLFRQVDLGGGLVLPKTGVASDASEDDDLVGRAMGTSKGHWDGQTLVVVTDNFVENTLVDNLVPHGYGMKVTERLRRSGADTLEDRITIEDPEYFTHAWETVVSYTRQPDEAFPEDVCLDRLDASGLPLPGK